MLTVRDRIKSQLIERIKGEQLLSGKTVEDFAMQIIGVSRTRYYAWLRGDVSVDTLLDVMDKLGVNLRVEQVVL